MSVTACFNPLLVCHISFLKRLTQFSVVLLKTLEAAIAVVTYSQVRISASEITRAHAEFTRGKKNARDVARECSST